MRGPGEARRARPRRGMDDDNIYTVAVGEPRRRICSFCSRVRLTKREAGLCRLGRLDHAARRPVCACPDPNCRFETGALYTLVYHLNEGRCALGKECLERHVVPQKEWFAPKAGTRVGENGRRGVPVGIELAPEWVQILCRQWDREGWLKR